MTGRGVLLVVSAPSGAGKSTLCNMLLGRFPQLRYSISCTTRPKRGSEEHGKDYYFLSHTEFLARRDKGQFAEWAEVHGHLYGTPLSLVENSLAAGQDLLLDVDVQGAAQIRQNLPESRLVFILPPDIGELERRLRHRGLDNEVTIQRRMARARDEIREAFWYDAVILNREIAQALDSLAAFYNASKLAPACNTGLIASALGEQS